MSIELLSKTIDRTKLAAITNDFETIKYFENLQRDLSGPVSDGIGQSDEVAQQALQDAAAAKAAADAAEVSASNAQVTANGAQMTATNAGTAAAAAQSTASGAATAASNAQTDATFARNLSVTINADYVSKTAGAMQSVANTFQATAFYVAGLQVVGARETGWTVGTGTSNKGAFAGNTLYTVGATYNGSEVTAIATGLTQANQRILALERTLRTHGLIS